MSLTLEPSLIDALTDDLLRADPFDGPFYCRARQLNAHGRVLAVFGSGHWSAQRRALEAMVGRPVEQAQRAEG